MQRYRLEFILYCYNASLASLKSSLAEFSEGLDICDCDDPTEKPGTFKVRIHTQEPTAIFDICAQFGRIRSIKVDEERS